MFRSKYIKIALFAVVAIVGGVNVFNAQKSESLSDVALANVEALAEEEWYDGVCYWDKLYNKCVENGQTKIPCPCGALG